MHSRILSYLNWLIAAVLVFAAAAVLWFAWRPLPKTSGSLEMPVSAGATVTRDERGIPHIKAASMEDAFFLQGFVTAQDRLWQMDIMRRHASGTLAEIAGKGAVEEDTTARRLRLRRLAEAAAERLPADDRKWIAAYARGVNHYIATHMGKLPAEFTVMGYDPRPWSVADTLVIGLDMHRTLTGAWKREVARAAVSGGGNPELLRQLFPPRTGLEMHPGSNAWAISGKHTASGKPLLANDPHLEFGVPSTWYLNRLEAPGLNVTGASLPGVPAIIIGHNDRIAWGVTNLEFDVQDLYLERLDTQTGRYVHKGELRQARLEREVIVVKDAETVDFSNWVTHHGPVWNSVGQQSLTLRWTAAEPGGVAFVFAELNQARDWASFRKALSRFPGPGQNFVYADTDGNIGYQATGVLPIRKTFRGNVPVDGVSGQYEWEGFIPFDELPSVYNPPSGRVVTANQNPFPADYPHPVNGEFDAGYRARQIDAMLRSRSGLKAPDMLTVQKDVYSAYSHFLAQCAVRAKGADAEAVGILRDWNGQMEANLAAPVIAQLLNQQLRLEIGKRAANKAIPADSPFTSAVVERLLRDRPREWFSDWDAVIVRALNAALEEGKRQQGRNPAEWKYGAMIALEMKHPVFAAMFQRPGLSLIPWVSNLYKVGPVMMSGSPTSVKQITGRLGPSMRFVADAGDWDRSLANLTLGQSGHVLSGHFKDQWAAWWEGKSFPLSWKTAGKETLEVRPKMR